MRKGYSKGGPADRANAIRPRFVLSWELVVLITAAVAFFIGYWHGRPN